MCGGVLSKPKMPEPIKVAPTATTVSNTDTGGKSSIMDEVERLRKKRGFASTKADKGTIAGQSSKSTLG